MSLVGWQLNGGAEGNVSFRAPRTAGPLKFRLQDALHAGCGLRRAPRAPRLAGPISIASGIRQHLNHGSHFVRGQTGGTAIPETEGPSSTSIGRAKVNGTSPRGKSRWTDMVPEGARRPLPVR